MSLARCNVSDAQAPAHTKAGMIRVASTGPFTDGVASANSYRLTYPGGDLGVSGETIKYAAHFLGQTKDSASPIFNTVVCKRASPIGETLPISVTLREGGQGKSPAPNYQDTLTITVTPLATPFVGGTSDCPTL